MLTYRVVVKETEKSKIEEDVRSAVALSRSCTRVGGIAYSECVCVCVRVCVFVCVCAR